MSTTWGGRPRARARQECFQRYGHTCWVCGHGGAHEVDHLHERGQGGESYGSENLRPIHGSSSPCPICKGERTGRPRCCNQERNRKAGRVRQGVVVDLGRL